MHIETVLCKANKGTSIIKKLRHTLPIKSLLTIYKACVIQGKSREKTLVESG